MKIPVKAIITTPGRRKPNMLFIPKIKPEIAVIQVGKGGFSYRASPFIVVKIQLLSNNISLAVIKLRASIIVTSKMLRVGNSISNTNRIIL